MNPVTASKVNASTGSPERDCRCDETGFPTPALVLLALFRQFRSVT